MRSRWSLSAPITALLSCVAGADSSVSDLNLRVTQADIEPVVTIEEFDNRRVERYSVNNNTYMIKITPAAGSPYYLVDEDGSGEMDWKQGMASAENNVPQWVLFNW